MTVNYKKINGSAIRPAVHHHGSGVRRVAGFDPAQEGQERRGMFRDAVIRPRRELELPHLSLLAGAVLNSRETFQPNIKTAII